MGMEMNTIVTLQRQEADTGYPAGDSVEAEAAVWAYVEEPTATFRAQMGSGGFGVDLIAHCWRAEYDAVAPTHVIKGGNVYRIETEGRSVNDQLIKLLLRRGRI